MRIYAISGNFRRGDVDIIGVKNQIVEAESEAGAVQIICRQLEKRYYNVHGREVFVIPDCGHIHIQSLGFHLMGVIRDFSDTVAAGQLENYKEKFTDENLEEIARLTKIPNAAAHQWAEKLIQDRAKKNHSEK